MSSGLLTELVLSIDHPQMVGRSGRGVRVAVIDSGVTPGHPHLPAIHTGLSFDAAGQRGADYVDRLGHGTAVAAAIHEKAPDAELVPIRIFETTLETHATVLVAAIDAAIGLEVDLVNLSLGTANRRHEGELVAVLKLAAAAGIPVVSPAAHDGQRWLPGSLPTAVGVELDWDLDRHRIRRSHSGLRWRASGYPRPVPGVPPDGNLRGVSFAAANVTGLLARAMSQPA